MTRPDPAAPCGAHPITEDCCCLCHEAGRAEALAEYQAASNDIHDITDGPGQLAWAAFYRAWMDGYDAVAEQAARKERHRIYQPDNFPGDGSVGPDEIPEEYRHLDAAYWHRRWLWTMNRLDEAPTVWDVDNAEKRGAAAERRRIRELAIAADAFYDAPCPDGDPDCIHQDTPFADLLDGDDDG